MGALGRLPLAIQLAGAQLRRKDPQQWLAKFDDAGWRIDIEEFKRRNGKDTAFAIPSPARREGKNWVVESVPLVASRTERKLSKAS